MVRVIDFHTHIGRLVFSRKPLTSDILVSTMDRLGIEKAVVLPIENPEEVHYYSTTEYVLSECAKHPGRLIPFCSVDPRRGVPENFAPSPDLAFNPRVIIEEYVNRGCKGFGECLQGLPIDDPRSSKLYDACGELGLPVVLHIMHSFINYDKVGLPGLERLLRKHKDTTFIAHANGWWSEISAEVDPTIAYGYPTGKVKPGGRVGELLEKYENLYADISAQSGYNALTRDPEFGVNFLEEHYEKLLFGTDYSYDGQELPIVDYIKTVEISRRAFRAITRENAEKLLNI